MRDKKRNLRVYERADLYPQSISYYLDLFKLSPRRYPFIANYWEVVAYKDSYFWWARDTDYLERFFRLVFGRLLADSRFRQKIFSWYRRDIAVTRRQTMSLKNLAFTKISDKKLWLVYHLAQKMAFRHLIYSEYLTDLFDDYFAKLFAEHLEPRVAIFPADWLELIHSATLTAGAEFRLALLKLSFKKQPALVHYIVLLDKYSWIQMGWDGSGELDEKRLRREFRKLKNAPAPERRVEIKSIQTYSKQVRKKRSQLLKKYGLKRAFTDRHFYLLDHFNIFHDYRKEIQMKCNQIIYRVLREIPKRFPIVYDDLKYYYNHEVESLLKTGKLVDKKIIRQRQIGITWFIQSGKIKEYLGKTAGEKLEKLVLAVVRAGRVAEIKGLPVSRGVVKGRVFVTKNTKGANQSLKAGEILIASMTMPDYLPAMKKAGGVVTDDGGVTCHAAVISRELGIPCIVGTKIATQVLKTGDKVLMDANKGIIKKLE